MGVQHQRLHIYMYIYIYTNNMTYLGYTGNKTDFGIAQVFSLFMAGISPRLDGFHTQHGCYQLGGPPEAGVLQYHL